jgi:hypothetical protein
MPNQLSRRPGSKPGRWQKKKGVTLVKMCGQLPVVADIDVDRNEMTKNFFGAIASTKRDRLEHFVTVANRTALEFNEGDRATCILTNYAAIHVLRGLGLDPRPLRVECGIFPDVHKLSGTILGSRHRGRRASPGMWNGHLVTILGSEWLLDPTVDQANKADEWGPEISIDPLVVPISEKFLDPTTSTQAWGHGRSCRARYIIFPRQTGFARTPDARPSHWMPLTKIISAKWGVN